MPETESGTPAPNDAEKVEAKIVDDAPEGVAEEGAADAEEAPVIEIVDPHTQIQQDLKDAQARLRTVSKAYTDLQAEMKSFRARVEAQEKAKAVQRTAGIVKGLLEPVDNLRRSIEHPGDEVSALVDGLKLVEHQFTEALNKVGLAKVGAVGEQFNPNQHEALAMTPVTDASMDGRILMVHASGYSLQGHVLQPAQVIVGKFEAQAPEPEPEEAEADDA